VLGICWQIAKPKAGVLSTQTVVSVNESSEVGNKPCIASCFFWAGIGRNPIQDASREGHSSSDGSGVGGMIISRRPYRLASSEKAPGPKHEIATAMMEVKTELTLTAMGSEPGSQASATLMPMRAASTDKKIVK